jgi:hypothetical protein
VAGADRRAALRAPFHQKCLFFLESRTLFSWFLVHFPHGSLFTRSALWRLRLPRASGHWCPAVARSPPTLRRPRLAVGPVSIAGCSSFAMGCSCCTITASDLPRAQTRARACTHTHPRLARSQIECLHRWARRQSRCSCLPKPWRHAEGQGQCKSTDALNAMRSRAGRLPLCHRVFRGPQVLQHLGISQQPQRALGLHTQTDRQPQHHHAQQRQQIISMPVCLSVCLSTRTMYAPRHCTNAGSVCLMPV